MGARSKISVLFEPGEENWGMLSWRYLVKPYLELQILCHYKTHLACSARLQFCTIVLYQTGPEYHSIFKYEGRNVVRMSNAECNKLDFLVMYLFYVIRSMQM
jgi:hypothetical protein